MRWFATAVERSAESAKQSKRPSLGIDARTGTHSGCAALADPAAANGQSEFSWTFEPVSS